MDRAPFQVLDVHELLDSTLIMLSRKIGDGIKVVKDYDRTLPDIPVYGAELNQVWTNLIDNALQAMDGAGHADDPHQPASTTPSRSRSATPARASPTRSSSRIFEPFFTTKPVGEGTGLGLDISWRIVVNKHHGDLSVRVRAGRHRVPRPPAAARDRGRPP